MFDLMAATASQNSFFSLYNEGVQNVPWIGSDESIGIRVDFLSDRMRFTTSGGYDAIASAQDLDRRPRVIRGFNFLNAKFKLGRIRREDRVKVHMRINFDSEGQSEAVFLETNQSFFYGDSYSDYTFSLDLKPYSKRIIENVELDVNMLEDSESVSIFNVWLSS